MGDRYRIDPALAWLMVLALAVRIPIALFTVYHHADEVWQYIEPAYGLVTGDWIRTWDIRLGIRSWLLPLILLGPVWLGHALAPVGELHLVLSRLFMALLSLGSVWAGWSLGLQISRRHAIVAGFVAAVWIDFAYFASRTSSDTFSVLAILPGLALLYRYRDRGGAGLFWAGFLIGLGFITRFPLGPALAIPFLWAGRMDFRKAWVPLIAGALAPIACDVLANAVMGQMPLVWIVRNVVANVIEQRSHAFGVAPPWWYAQVLGWQWMYIAAALVPAIAFGARRYPMLFWAALAVIAVHSSIGHKEYRFILLGVSLLVLLAAVGSVDMADWLGRGRKAVARPVWLMVFWLGASVEVAASEPFVINWTVGKAPLEAMRTVRATPRLCGVATYRIRDVPFISRAVLNRPVPAMLINTKAALTLAEPRFNVVVTPAEDVGDLSSNYRVARCITPAQPAFEQRYCVLVRQGACTAAPGLLDYNTALRRMER